MSKVELVFYLVAAGEWKYIHACENIGKAIKGNTKWEDWGKRKKKKSDAEEDMEE